jgi:hypothetical protein
VAASRASEVLAAVRRAHEEMGLISIKHLVFDPCAAPPMAATTTPVVGWWAFSLRY